MGWVSQREAAVAQGKFYHPSRAFCRQFATQLLRSVRPMVGVGVSPVYLFSLWDNADVVLAIVAAMLVPVAISYDKVIEGGSYVNEMLGGSKKKENLVDFLNALNATVRLNFGSIDIKIMPPISLRQTLFAPLTPSSPLSHDYFKAPRLFVSSLAHRVLHACNSGVTTTATTLVASLLLTAVNRGIHTKELVDRVDWLKKQVRDAMLTCSYT